MNPFDVIRLRTAGPTTKYLRVTSGTTFTTPSDWNNANNKVHCIGAGANGLVGSGTGGNAFGKQGGGGGAYAVKNNMTLSGSVACQIGAANSGVDTFVVNATTLLAKAAAANSATGGAVATSIGDSKFAGGNGDPGGVTGGDPSGAGGGAGGPAGAGQAASGMTGGSGNAGSAGGGNGGVSPGGAGGNGTLWNAGLDGPGGGGGGRNTTGVGGAGGTYGAGGGGGYASSGGAGAAKAGVIVLQWTPP